MNKIDFIISKYKDSASEKKGAAYTTGSCVVGNDMDKAIFIVDDFYKDLKGMYEEIGPKECLEMATQLYDLAANLEYSDTEGYVEGTIRSIADEILG